MDKAQRIKEHSEALLKMLANLSESELSRLVLLHNRKYFLENAPEITDEAFDKLVEALRFINPTAEALTEIGAKEVGQFGSSVVHASPMLSLDKCYDDDTFRKWAEKIRCDFVIMPKIDGLALSILYDLNGNLVRSATRGDGFAGEDITQNILTLSRLPHVLPERIVRLHKSDEPYIEVRGEAFMAISRFTKHFAKEFANPRNLAAGALKQKSPQKSKAYGLRFFPYDLRGVLVEDESEKFVLLKEAGFDMMPWAVVKNDAQATGAFREYLAKRAEFDFEIDGVVFRAVALAEQRRLGETAHHPRFALAYKFQGESAVTQLVAVEWSVARSGVITPVAIFLPVVVSGATITRASLHNYAQFLHLGLASQSLIEITRRGGVIPHVERVLSAKGEPIKPCDTCPSCHGPVEVRGEFLYCTQPKKCLEVAVSKLLHFCQVVDLEGFGEKMVRRLVDEGAVARFGDIFRLDEQSLLPLEHMGETLAKKLLHEIEDHKKIPLATLLRALGIKEVGANASELIAANFPSMEQLFALTKEDLTALHGIGESIASSFVDGLKENRDDIEDLLSLIEIGDVETVGEIDIENPFYDKSVLFTGKMAHLERKAAQALVHKKGGKTPDAMSSKVDFLVIGDEDYASIKEGKKSTKHKQAEKLQAEGASLKIISESEFLALVEG